MKKEHERHVWNREFCAYFNGNQRLDTIATLIRGFTGVRRVLDVGCNRGVLAGLLPGIDYHGVDFIVNGTVEGLNIKQYDINSDEDLPHTDNFDVVVMSGILEYSEAPSKLLARVASWIEPGGHLLISYTNFWYLPILLRKMVSLKTNFHQTWKNSIDFDLLRRILADEGLPVEREISVDIMLSMAARSYWLMPRSWRHKDLGDLVTKQKLFVSRKGERPSTSSTA
jgi:SAM-dependent methyltransferase